MTKILVKRFGSIESRHVDKVLEVLNSVFSKCPSRDRPAILELHVYPDRRVYKTYSILESIELSVKGGLNQEFLAYHDAWTGIPRIHVILKVLNSTPENIARSILVHEAVHAILHGVLSSYLLSMPSTLLETNIPDVVKWEVLHSIASSIKDYEVTTYILSKNLDSNLEDYICYVLESGVEELEAVKDLDFLYTLLKTSTTLKLLAPASALKKYNIESFKVRRAVEDVLSSFPETLQRCISELTFDVMPSLRGELQDKVNHLVERIVFRVREFEGRGL